MPIGLTNDESNGITVTAGAAVTFYSLLNANEILMLTAYAQVNAEGTSLRFVATVDSLDYNGVGFIIEIGGKQTDVPVSVVYTSIKAGGRTLNASDINSYANFVFTYTLRDIPETEKDTEILVTAYRIEKDGTKTFGAQAKFTLAGVQAQG